MAVVKSKAGMAVTIPSSTIYYYQIYGLKMVKEKQTTQQISMLHRQLNHQNFENSTLKIRLQQIQNSANTNLSILECSNYVLTYKKSRTTTVKVLNYLENLGMSIVRNILNNWPKQLEEQGSSINTVLRNMENKEKIKTRC